MPVAETFTFEDEEGRGLSDITRLDTMVTVVDAYNFLKDYSSSDSLSERNESLGDDDDRTVVDLLIEQVEFCDVMVISKADLISKNELLRLLHILHTLNPRAEKVYAHFGQVPLDKILNTGRFDFEEAASAPGWLASLRGERLPESETYGISNFVYRAQRPFHPQRFWDLIHTEWNGVIRSKGYFWLASRMAFAGEWSQAGGACRHGAGGLWRAAMDQADEPDDNPHTMENSDAAFGDRRQELVLIGIDMDRAAITEKLDACLLTDTEMALGDAAWQRFPDPFPVWRTMEDSEVETDCELLEE